MEERIIMNSSNLQTLFAKEYETFFLENNLVISVPQIINLGCIYNKDQHNPQIRKKIPSKMFLGINIHHGPENIVYKDLTYFSSSQKHFIKTPRQTIFANIGTPNLQENFESMLSELGCTKHIEMSLLSENEKGSGIEFGGVTTVLLAAAIYILAEKISVQQLNDEAIFLNSPFFENIYETYKKLLKKSTIDSNGIIARTAMEHHWRPMISPNAANNINKKTSKIMNMWEFFNIKNHPEQPMPIDYGILDFGSVYDESYINNVYENLKKTHVGKDQDSLTEISSHLNDNLIQAWGNIFKSNYNDQQAIDNFVDIIGQQGLFETFIEKENAVFADIMSLFHQTKQFSDEKIGITTLTSNKPGGSFFFVVNHSKSRETMEKLLTKLKENGHIAAHYQYLSRIDGYTNEGLKIEQYIDKSFYSPHIKNSNDIMESCNGTKIIGNHRKLLEQAEDGIVFDGIDGKIYINNEITNHNEIPTQSGTVEVIKVLFENMGSYVNNSKLPPSSYSKNKNEMVGKIIGPLQELAQKKFNEKLELECTGSIVDFDLKLTPNKINLHLLKKIHQ